MPSPCLVAFSTRALLLTRGTETEIIASVVYTREGGLVITTENEDGGDLTSIRFPAEDVTIRALEGAA